MNNNNRLVLVAIIFGSLALSLPVASADSLILDWGIRTDQNGGFDGGEFNAYSTTLSPAALGYNAASASQTMASVGHGMGFETFCVETNEYFTPGSSYYYQISEEAKAGGAGGPKPDPISVGTAWLYEQFAHGDLPSYNYAQGKSSTSAVALQNAIWWLENEIDQDLTNPYENLAIAHFGGSAAAAMADNEISPGHLHYGVGVLNLWTTFSGGVYSGNAQDQLILIPSVPDQGATFLFLGIGLLGLILVKRKLSRQHLFKA